MAARTRADYRRDAARHIIPDLGHLPIDELTADRAARWAADRNIADKTLRNVHALLSAAVTTAVADGHLVSNSIRGIRLRRRTEHLREEMFTLTPVQYQLLLDELAEHW